MHQRRCPEFDSGSLTEGVETSMLSKCDKIPETLQIPEIPALEEKEQTLARKCGSIWVYTLWN